MDLVFLIRHHHDNSSHEPYGKQIILSSISEHSHRKFSKVVTNNTNVLFVNYILTCFAFVCQNKFVIRPITFCFLSSPTLKSKPLSGLGKLYILFLQISNYVVMVTRENGGICEIPHNSDVYTGCPDF